MISEESRASGNPASSANNLSTRKWSSVRRWASASFAAPWVWCLAWALVLIAPNPRTAEAESLTVLTYNLWHGFWRTPERELLMLPSESRRDRERRQSLQLEELERLEPDVLMAQEVHPLPWRARQLARGIGHRSIHQMVSCGVRFLHLGVPWSVRSGLALTAKPELDLRRVGGPLLSGRYGFCSDWLGLQLEEARRALLGRIRLEDGRHLLLVTTHLHSSTEGGPARGARRLRETRALLAEITDARRRDPEIAGVILGGDLNALSGSKPIELLRDRGYVDVARAAGAERATYDPWTNEVAARMVRAGGGRPERSEPRRIDYLFVSSELARAVRSVDLYGIARPGRPADSDHFGVLLELELDGSP